MPGAAEDDEGYAFIEDETFEGVNFDRWISWKGGKHGGYLLVGGVRKINTSSDGEAKLPAEVSVQVVNTTFKSS